MDVEVELKTLASNYDETRPALEKQAREYFGSTEFEIKDMHVRPAVVTMAGKVEEFEVRATATPKLPF